MSLKKLGIPADDYDIQNNFGETDHVIDLFSEIETAYRQQATIAAQVQVKEVLLFQ